MPNALDLTKWDSSEREEEILEDWILTGLAAIAMALLAIVSGGVLYLTLAEWRDRRRLQREKRASKASGRNK